MKTELLFCSFRHKQTLWDKAGNNLWIIHFFPFFIVVVLFFFKYRGLTLSNKDSSYWQSFNRAQNLITLWKSWVQFFQTVDIVILFLFTERSTRNFSFTLLIFLAFISVVGHTGCHYQSSSGHVTNRTFRRGEPNHLQVTRTWFLSLSLYLWASSAGLCWGFSHVTLCSSASQQPETLWPAG